MAADDAPTRPAHDGHDAPLTANTRSLESTLYQQAVDLLRARGCRCTLRFNGTTAVPVWPSDAATCVVEHSDGVGQSDEVGLAP